MTIAQRSLHFVQAVQKTMDEVQHLLEKLSSMNNPNEKKHASLAQACIYVLDMPLPPKKRRHTSSTCCITGTKLKAEVFACCFSSILHF